MASSPMSAAGSSLGSGRRARSAATIVLDRKAVNPPRFVRDKVETKPGPGSHDPSLTFVRPNRVGPVYIWGKDDRKRYLGNPGKPDKIVKRRVMQENGLEEEERILSSERSSSDEGREQVGERRKKKSVKRSQKCAPRRKDFDEEGTPAPNAYHLRDNRFQPQSLTNEFTFGKNCKNGLFPGIARDVQTNRRRVFVPASSLRSSSHNNIKDTSKLGDIKQDEAPSATNTKRAIVVTPSAAEVVHFVEQSSATERLLDVTGEASSSLAQVSSDRINKTSSGSTSILPGSGGGEEQTRQDDAVVVEGAAPGGLCARIHETESCVSGTSKNKRKLVGAVEDDGILVVEQGNPQDSVLMVTQHDANDKIVGRSDEALLQQETTGNIRNISTHKGSAASTTSSGDLRNNSCTTTTSGVGVLQNTLILEKAARGTTASSTAPSPEKDKSPPLLVAQPSLNTTASRSSPSPTSRPRSSPDGHLDDDGVTFSGVTKLSGGRLRTGSLSPRVLHRERDFDEIRPVSAARESKPRPLSPLDKVRKMDWNEQVSWFEKKIKEDGPLGLEMHRYLTHLVSNPTLKTHRMVAEKEQLKRTLERKSGKKSNQREMLGVYQYVWPKFVPERS